MSFFKTPEYQAFTKVHARVQQPGGNTQKNMDVYFDRLEKAILLAEKDYNSIGTTIIDKNGIKIEGYKWATSPELSKPMDYAGSVLFYSEIFDENIAVHADLSITFGKSGIHFDSEEVVIIKEANKEEMLRLFDLKRKFKGCKITSKEENYVRPEEKRKSEPDRNNYEQGNL